MLIYHKILQHLGDLGLGVTVVSGYILDGVSLILLALKHN